MADILTRDEISRIEMNVMSVGCSDSNARRLLDHAVAALDELDNLRAAISQAHEDECGCTRPGNPVACVALAIGEVAALSAEGRQAE